ncbi:MAG: hypothetical protein ACREPV_01590 [Lysobacter sp.]
MLRLCLCLLFALSSATVAAREVKMSSPNSGACPDAHASTGADVADAATPATAAAAPRETKIKPSVHSDVPSRLGSPRWHSFLPGMFR